MKTQHFSWKQVCENNEYIMYIIHYVYLTGRAVAQLVEALRYKPVSCVFNSRWFHWNFSLKLSLQHHYNPGVGSASNRNVCQEYILRGKADRCVRLPTYPLHVPIILKTRSLKLLESSVNVHEC